MNEDSVDDIVGAWRAALDRGEVPDPEAVIRAHPDLADDLRRRFAALSILERKLGPPSPPPSSVGEYRILREIGRGGMGVVYEAEQSSMRRKVALKVLFPTVTSSAKAVKRFQQEAWAAGRLKHTNIVAVHQLGQERGVWYCAMELVEGRPLSEVVAELRRAKGSPQETGLARAALSRTPASNGSGRTTGARAYHARVAEMFAQVAEALQVAHDHGVVHRDVKPANLLLDAEGRLKLADFGLARLEEGAAGMTVTGEVLGTPLYMSPEQIAGGHGGVDARTDVYSLGATLYEVLTLRLPFKGENVQQIAAAILSRDPAPARRWDRVIPRDLETIVAKSMEKVPARRYRTAGDMAADLRLFAQGAAIRARRIGPLGRGWRKIRRHKIPTLLVVALLLAAGAGVIVAVDRSRERAERLDLEYIQLCVQAEEESIRVDARAEREPLLATSAPTLAAGATTERLSASGVFTEAIALLPDRPEAYLGRALAPNRTMDQRLGDLESAGARGAAPRTVHYARALFLRQAGKLDAAAREEGLAASAAQGDAAAVLQEALLLERRGETTAALDRLDRIARDERLRPRLRYQVLLHRSRLRNRGGDLEGAIADLYGAQALAGEQVALSVRCASLWCRLGNTTKGDALFKAAVDSARAADNEDVWRAVAYACLESGEYAWCLGVCDSGIRLFPGSAGLHRYRGAGLSQLGRKDQALAAYDRALDLDSRSAMAYEGKGRVLNDLGRREDALVAYDRALEIDPQSNSAHCNRGTALYELRRYEDALAAYDSALRLDPYVGFVHSNRGSALMELGRWDEALLAYERAIDLDPHSALGYGGRGRALSKLGRAEEALIAYDRALDVDPSRPTYHRERGDALVALGRMEEALVAYDRALQLDPSLAVAHANRGAVLVALHRTEAALAAYERALELDPDDVLALCNRGAVLGELGRWPEALAACDRALGLDPTHSRAHANRGAVLKNVGRLDEALVECDRAVQLQPGSSEAYAQRGDVLIDLGRLAEALRDLDRAVHLNPRLPGAHYSRGVALNRLGRPQESLAEFEQVLELDPRDAHAHNGRGALLCDGRPEEALAAFDRAIDLAPSVAIFHDNRGNALRCLGRIEEALTAYDRALAIDPRLPGAHGHRGAVLLDLGRLEESLAACDRALALAPGSNNVRQDRCVVLVALGRFDEALIECDRAAGVPPDPVVLDRIAWCMALGTPGEKDSRGYPGAVDLARRAVALAPGDGSMWNTLGVALCRACEFEESAKALERSMELTSGGSAWDWLFLAIDLEKLGREDLARRWYDKGASWLRDQKAADGRLQGVRQEAAALLGIEPATK